MKPLAAGLCACLCVITLNSCTPKVSQNTEETTQLDTVDSLAAAPVSEEESRVVPNEIIDYSGAVSDSIKSSLEDFSPLSNIISLSRTIVSLKDSIKMAQNIQEITDPSDIKIFSASENEVYQKIVEYQQLMASGTTPGDKCPELIQLRREVNSKDSSQRMLPLPGKSKFFTQSNFFFLGGAPFIYKMQQDDGSVYSDMNGNPETRFESSITENANYFLKSIYSHYKNQRVTVTFGPPLESNEFGSKEVHGIGSLIHEFVNRFPVYFLTESGVVPATILSVEVRIVDAYQGCVSSQPRIRFACSKNLAENEILGVYISYGSTSVTSCAATRSGNMLWTADLDGDGVDELACVSGTFSGAISDTMAELLWYVNINGDWKIIDWGEELDCT